MTNTATATSAQPTAGVEQRVAPRHSCSLAALTQLVVPATGQRYFAWVHDISASGMALDMRAPLEAGAEIVCRLKGTHADEQFETKAQVVHLRLNDGLYRTGCKFATPFPATHLEAVLRKLRGGA